MIWINIQIQKKNLPTEQSLLKAPIQNNSAAPIISQPSENYSEIENEADSIEQSEEVIGNVGIGNLQSQWTVFLELLLKERPNLGSFLSMASICSISADTVELKLSSGYRFQYMELTRKNNQSEITRILTQFTGCPVELKITLDSSAPSVEDTNYIKQIGNIPNTIDDQIEKEPIIQTILEIFDGEILN